MNSQPHQTGRGWQRDLSLCLMACLLLLPLSLQAGSVHLNGVGGSFFVPIDSSQEARWRRVIPQQYDYSCGSAAIATLLTYHYGSPTSEEQVLQAMFAAGDQQRIRAEGFSMLDMKRYLDARGLRADGFRGIALGKWSEIGAPAIVLVNTNGYKHFVVVAGIQGDRVLLSDPAAGSIALTREQFQSIWNGIVLAAREKLESAQAHFNQQRDWGLWPKAPVAQGRDPSGLGTFTLTLPGRLPGMVELGR